ncbi:MAG: hypothetical protein DRR16_33100 [Candidatus Parabeggiatoa sp. nov. 3]|nr:MAG: hypothetical protein DRR00_12520 [Gammaproteobacteria bacterium]RKZ65898.1 MAG: hypothetical protein DRQ99_11305 [Gammaproteobacteria bacterium]RKZ73414.1 MAG: hypothetical protein DRR16_33100 [Gammaproteobacteria bacterium]
MVGKRALTLRASVKFIGARLPTLRIGVEKKVAKIPEIEHLSKRANLVCLALWGARLPWR